MISQPRCAHFRIPYPTIFFFSSASFLRNVLCHFFVLSDKLFSGLQPHFQVPLVLRTAVKFRCLSPAHCVRSFATQLLTSRRVFTRSLLGKVRERVAAPRCGYKGAFRGSILSAFRKESGCCSLANFSKLRLESTPIHSTVTMKTSLIVLCLSSLFLVQPSTAQFDLGTGHSRLSQILAPWTSSFSSAIERMFNDSFFDFGRHSAAMEMCRPNVTNDGQLYTVTCNVKGFQPEDVKVSWQGGGWWR